VTQAILAPLTNFADISPWRNTLIAKFRKRPPSPEVALLLLLVEQVQARPSTKVIIIVYIFFFRCTNEI
jgi:hypothetical protein